jgi:GYF domain 2
MPKTYYLNVSGREEGPWLEAEVAQMFADGRVNRNTPCRLEAARDWKTIDDYLPTLKYGTQLPPATPRAVQITTSPSTTVAAQRVAIVDLDIPFLSLVKIMFKWMAAGFVVFCCFIPLIILVWLIVMAVFAT